MKFLAWDRIEEVFLDDVILTSRGEIVRDGIVYGNGEIIVAHFTGIKDVSGVDLHESDVVTFKSSIDKKKCYGVIRNGFYTCQRMPFYGYCCGYHVALKDDVCVPLIPGKFKFYNHSFLVDSHELYRLIDSSVAFDLFFEESFEGEVYKEIKRAESMRGSIGKKRMIEFSIQKIKELIEQIEAAQ